MSHFELLSGYSSSPYKLKSRKLIFFAKKKKILVESRMHDRELKVINFKECCVINQICFELHCKLIKHLFASKNKLKRIDCATVGILYGNVARTNIILPLKR